MPSLIPFSRSAAILTVAGFTMLSGHRRGGRLDAHRQHPTTPRGTYNSSGAGGCAGGTRSRASTVNGPAGGTASHTGSVTRTSPGTYSYQGSSTGPAGNSVSRSGTVSRY